MSSEHSTYTHNAAPNVTMYTKVHIVREIARPLSLRLSISKPHTFFALEVDVGRDVRFAELSFHDRCVSQM